MIGAHEVKWTGGQHKFKLSTRAMMRIETATDLPLSEALQSIGEADAEGNLSNFSVSKLVACLAPMMDEGKGGTDDEAADLIDAMGIEAAATALFKAAEMALDPGQQSAGGNGKGRKART